MNALRPRFLSSVDCQRHDHWLDLTRDALRYQGFMVIENVLDADRLCLLREKMYEVQHKIQHLIGQERLEQAGEIGVLRLMMQFDPIFIHLLAMHEMLAVVDATVSETAILHLQNGFILPSSTQKISATKQQTQEDSAFQHTFHRDFPRVLNGYRASVNVLFALDDFTEENGATRLVPGIHQQNQSSSPDYLENYAISACCPAGFMLVFDSTLLYASGRNASNQDRLSINQQFTRSYMKQQIDYVRALGEAAVMAQPPRTQQLLGYYTRVVTSLEEYYQPEEKRLYRKGQG